MIAITLTCDQQNDVKRVALWRGKELCDLYLERTDKPDITNAIIHAKVDRIAPRQKAAWLDGGLGRMIYCENPGPLKSGEIYRVRITSCPRGGKAYGGIVIEPVPREGKIGIISAPPPLWQRAFMDANRTKITSLLFAERDDYNACCEWLQKKIPQLLSSLRLLSKDSIAPELDEAIETLHHPVVSLPRGGSIVIEKTEAFVAVDINVGDADNSNALAFNLQAVKEIARQIRLRNLSGIIVIDALKMKRREDNMKVLNALSHATASDPADVNVFGITKLGLIEMTRKRRGWSVDEILTK